MDRYFYSVGLDGKDNKMVHISGNIYWNDVDETETNYRCAEWTGMSFTLKELKEEVDSHQLFNTLCENVRYLDNITNEEALKISDTYFGDEIISLLPIHCVDQDTPCGYYWFEGAEILQ